MSIITEVFARQILEHISEKQDIIFIIRPDLLELSLLDKLKNNTKKFVAYISTLKPHIMCGDFNIPREQNPLYKKLTDTGLIKNFCFCNLILFNKL